MNDSHVLYDRCPARGVESFYNQAMGRFIHGDETPNFECWALISSGHADSR